MTSAAHPPLAADDAIVGRALGRPARRVGVARAALLVVGLLTGCAPAPAPATPAASTTLVSPSGTSAAASHVPDAPSPWTQALDRISPDGTFTKEAALTLFALSFGDMPAVATPAGPRDDIRSGTLALRAVLAHQAELTDAQRQRVAEVRSIPDDGAGAPIEATIPEIRFAVSMAAVPTVGPDARHLLEAQAKQIRQEISGRIGGDIPGPIRIVFDPRNDRDGDVGMTDPVYSGGTYSGCTIHLYPNAFLVGRIAANTLAHEFVHCFQAAAYGTERAFDVAPSWLVEGSAEWAGATLAGPDKLETTLWPKYLNNPGTDLRTRKYDAIGFYAHLDETGHSPWAVFRKMWVAGSTSADAFVASGATDDAFLDSWGASTTRRRTLGAAWDTDGPGITDDEPAREMLAVGKGSIAVSAAPYAHSLLGLEISTDLVRVAIAGHGRLADGSVDTSVRDASLYCTRDGGCACPEGTGPDVPPVPLLASGASLALSGGPDGTKGTLQGLDLADICVPKPVAGQLWSMILWSPSQGENAPPLLAAYTCNGLASTWKVIYLPSLSALTRTFDLPFGAGPIVHKDIHYDIPADKLSPAMSLDYALDFELVATADPPVIKVSGTKSETQGGQTRVFPPREFGSDAPLALRNVSLETQLKGHPNYQHPFRSQALQECRS